MYSTCLHTFLLPGKSLSVCHCSHVSVGVLEHKVLSVASYRVQLIPKWLPEVSRGL